MASRLATWVWVGAAALACVAGMVNVVGYLGFEHQAITHLTGTTSLLGAALAQGNLRSVLQLAGMLLAFVLGAVLSGLLIKDSVLQLGRRYGVALAFEAVLLVLAVPLFEQGYFLGPLLAAVAIGLQNAMATTYSGAIIRTSHVSGMFTDLGITHRPCPARPAGGPAPAVAVPGHHHRLPGRRRHRRRALRPLAVPGAVPAGAAHRHHRTHLRRLPPPPTLEDHAVSHRPVSVLTIAGSDSGGGAGIQADLKTFAAHGLHGLSVVAALTAQHTRGVTAVHVPPVEFLRAQIDACFADFRIGAVKIGMLANADVIHAVADALEFHGSPPRGARPGDGGHVRRQAARGRRAGRPAGAAGADGHGGDAQHPRGRAAARPCPSPTTPPPNTRCRGCWPKARGRCCSRAATCPATR